MERISIITVCYNAENVIEQTIQSVINQCYINTEYIIIDGKSTDKTLDIVSKYKDKIAYICSEKDKGIYDAMNKGIAKASGNWINFMNAGDEFESNKTLEQIFTYNKENIMASDIIYGDTIVCTKIATKYTKCLKPFWVDTAFVHGKGICHQSIFIRTKLAKENPFDINYKICADYKMVYDLYSHGFKFTYLSIPIAKYEVENGISKKYAIRAYKESAMILKVDHTLHFRISFYLFTQKEWIRNSLSKLVQLICPPLFNYIKLKRL